MIDICLQLQRDSENVVHFLSIPLVDFQRLAFRPLKWCRFVAFAICGARGDLFESSEEDAPVVDYNNAELDENATYYYTPEGGIILIDYNALNDRISSTAATSRSRELRGKVIQRDGEHCIFTGWPSNHCDAAHIIPRSKGDGYILRVIADRSGLYDPPPPNVDPITSIDDVRNGVLLSKNTHSEFGSGEAALLTIPNFALDRDDIPRSRTSPTSTITLQYLQARAILGGPEDRLGIDAIIGGNGNLLPPAVLLDFMYGVAAFNQWRPPGGVHKMFKQRYRNRYAKNRFPRPRQPSGKAGESSRQKLLPYNSKLRSSKTDSGGRAGSSRRKPLEEAMDEMNLFLMYATGVTPEALAEKREAQEKEESRVKVMDWLEKTDEVS